MQEQIPMGNKIAKGAGKGKEKGKEKGKKKAEGKGLIRYSPTEYVLDPSTSLLVPRWMCSEPMPRKKEPDDKK